MGSFQNRLPMNRFMHLCCLHSIWIRVSIYDDITRRICGSSHSKFTVFLPKFLLNVGFKFPNSFCSWSELFIRRTCIFIELNVPLDFSFPVCCIWRLILRLFLFLCGFAIGRRRRDAHLS